MNRRWLSKDNNYQMFVTLDKEEKYAVMEEWLDCLIPRAEVLESDSDHDDDDNDDHTDLLLDATLSPIT